MGFSETDEIFLENLGLPHLNQLNPSSRSGSDSFLQRPLPELAASLDSHCHECACEIILAGYPWGLENAMSFALESANLLLWLCVTFLLPEANDFSPLDLYPEHVLTTEPGRTQGARLSCLPTEIWPVLILHIPISF